MKTFEALNSEGKPAKDGEKVAVLRSGSFALSQADDSKRPTVRCEK